MARVYVIGGANIDIFAKSHKELLLRDSNPSFISMSFGGVGRNIAANLAHFDEKISFVSCFANDSFGKMVYQSCLDLGFDMTYSYFKEGLPSSMYLAILDSNNDMYLATSDMRIVEGIGQSDLEELREAVTDEDYFVVDTNLKEETIAYIYENFKGTKVTDAISANKVHRLLPVLDKIDILKLNLIEAETLLKHELDSEEKIIVGLRALKKKGAREVLITTKKGAYLASDAIYYVEHDACDKDVKNTTGAGDSFLAAYVHAHSERMDPLARLRFALSTAVLTVRCEETVAPMTTEDVKQCEQEIHFEGGVKYVF